MARCVSLEVSRFLVELEHLVTVAVVGSDDQRAVELFDHGNDPRQRKINRLYRNDGRVEVSGVAHHVAVGVVDAPVPHATALNGCERRIRDLRRLHPRALLERNQVAGDLDVLFVDLIEHPASVAVPEVRHMSELLGLAAGELADLVARQVLAHGPVDLGRLHEVVTRELEVAVVLHHADKLDVRYGPTVELAELGLGKRKGELERAVATKVEEHDGRAIANRADRITLPVDDHEAQEVLVDHPGILVAKGLNRLGGARETPALTEHVMLPAALDHRPVGIVAVHRDEHAAAA